jgi:ABC-type lipoprotein release transport system permease subunit
VTVGKTGKMVLGAMLILTSLSVLSGFDKTFEARLVDASPRWLLDITTKF